MSLLSDTSTPTRIGEGFGPTWYHALTPVNPSSISGYGSDQNGPSALRPGAPGWFHTFGAGRFGAAFRVVESGVPDRWVIEVGRIGGGWRECREGTYRLGARILEPHRGDGRHALQDRLHLGDQCPILAGQDEPRVEGCFARRARIVGKDQGAPARAHRPVVGTEWAEGLGRAGCARWDAIHGLGEGANQSLNRGVDVGHAGVELAGAVVDRIVQQQLLALEDRASRWHWPCSWRLCRARTPRGRRRRPGAAMPLRPFPRAGDYEIAVSGHAFAEVSRGRSSWHVSRSRRRCVYPH